MKLRAIGRSTFEGIVFADGKNSPRYGPVNLHEDRLTIPIESLSGKIVGENKVLLVTRCFRARASLKNLLEGVYPKTTFDQTDRRASV